MIVKFDYILEIVTPLLLLSDTNILLFLAEQISAMPFYYVQDVYQKNQLGTRLDK